MQRTLDELSRDGAIAHLAIALALSRRPASERIVIVVDQLEEVFTLCRDEYERHAFVHNLLYAGSIPSGQTSSS
jgi:hypothetical protein